MSLISELQMYGRFALGLRGFLGQTMTVEQAGALIRERLAQREENFLHVMERGMFGHAQSPYRALLKLAQVELGDMRRMVRENGLQATLGALREAGVYITFEEFKGRRPIVRHGQTIAVQAGDFDNPFLKRHYYSESGGSTGVGSRVTHDLDHIVTQAAHQVLAFDMHKVLDVPSALWRGILPDGSGINNVLRAAHTGRVPNKWFTPIMTRDLKGPQFKYVLATYLTVVASRLLGTPVPWPQSVPLDEALVVARWAVEAVEKHGACLIQAPISRDLRVCLAAQQAELDLTGVTFRVSGEPITPAKIRGIISSGAKYFASYSFAEIGRIGMGCGQPLDPTDVHLLTDICTIIQHPRQVPGTDLMVDAFNFTTLLPTAPKLMLNVESDDYGILEQRSCGCPLEEPGLSLHVRQIHSFRKLTGEGITLVGSDILYILEEVLPGRFGGTLLDYQLQEEEDEHGFTRINLLISPGVEIVDERAVIDTLLEALGRSSVSADYARAVWDQARTIHIKRAEPVLTRRGKLLPLHIATRGEQALPNG